MLYKSAKINKHKKEYTNPDLVRSKSPFADKSSICYPDIPSNTPSGSVRCLGVLDISSKICHRFVNRYIAVILKKKIIIVTLISYYHHTKKYTTLTSNTDKSLISLWEIKNSLTSFQDVWESLICYKESVRSYVVPSKSSQIKIEAKNEVLSRRHISLTLLTLPLVILVALVVIKALLYHPKWKVNPKWKAYFKCKANL